MAGATPGLALDKRVALVIGNSGYQHTPQLSNPAHDAVDVGTTLRRLKFDVIEGIDLDKAGMDRTIRQFARALGNADVGLLFYAGHGLQVNGQNYLVPIDAKLEDASGLDFELVRLDLIHRTMERETKTSLLILDACRDNPLSRNLARAIGTRSAEIGHGLAAVESGIGTLIAFSTQPGNVALDGSGRNSPFAAALVKHMPAPGQDLSSLLIAVRNEVMTATRNRQVPWEHSALRARFYFVEPPLAGNPERDAEELLWSVAADGKSLALLLVYIDRYPNGAHAAAAASLIDAIKTEETSQSALVQKEAELRRAEEAKTRAELQKAQELMRAAEAERQAALKAAQEARAAAQAAREQQERLARPAGESKTAALSPAPATAKPQPEIGSARLSRLIQLELRRVGCDPGSIDGTWSAKSKSALAEFARQTKVAINVEAPSEAALDQLIKRQGRICPLACEGGMVEKGGACAASGPAPSKGTPSRQAGQGQDQCARYQRCANESGAGIAGMGQGIGIILRTCGAKPAGC
jgi:uncharacterized caspase-like protein